MRTGVAVALTVACILVLTLGLPVAAQSPSANVLIRSGFILKTADTPEKRARLSTFQQDRFNQRKDKNGGNYYVYADLRGCVCAYVGNQKAMDFYTLWRRGLLSSDQMGDPPTGGRESWEGLVVQEMQLGDPVFDPGDDPFRPDPF